MANEPILVTGASGFLGTMLCHTLSEHHVVDTLGRSSGNNYNLDLAIHVPVFDKRFQTVIHAAAKAHVIPRSKKEEEEFFQVNYQGTVNLLEGLKNSEKLPNEFVFISTVAVYGLEEGDMIDETFPLGGETPYAKSKIQAEVYLREWCEKYKVKLTILRLPLLVGQHPPGNLGDMIRMIRKGFYIGIGTGSARKSMVLTNDVAHFIPWVAILGGTYNLTDGYHPTLLELENAIAKRLGKKKLYRLPDSLIRLLASLGDLLGARSPINSHKFKKLTSSLTFSDAKAREVANWNPHLVIEHVPDLVSNK